MDMPDELVRKELDPGWKEFIINLEKSLDVLEKEIEFTSKMVNACTLEWCQSTEYAFDEINNALFSISEPAWTSDDDSKRLKALKRRVHDIYAKYKSAANQ